MSELGDIHEKLDMLIKLAYDGPSGTEISNAARNAHMACAKLTELKRVNTLDVYSEGVVDNALMYIRRATLELEKLYAKG